LTVTKAMELHGEDNADFIIDGKAGGQPPALSDRANFRDDFKNAWVLRFAVTDNPYMPRPVQDQWTLKGTFTTPVSRVYVANEMGGAVLETTFRRIDSATLKVTINARVKLTH
jgi:hypothetical protein